MCFFQRKYRVKSGDSIGGSARQKVSSQLVVLFKSHEKEKALFASAFLWKAIVEYEEFDVLRIGERKRERERGGRFYFIYHFLHFHFSSDQLSFQLEIKGS